MHRVGLHFNTFASQHSYLKRFIYLFILLLLLAEISSAQILVDSANSIVIDTTARPDTIVHRDSLPVAQTNLEVSKRPQQDSGWILEPADPVFDQAIMWQILDHHPYFGFKNRVSTVSVEEENIRQVRGKEVLFYSLVLLIIIFALLRQAFPKYFNDLFRLFFRTTLKQRQISEQLIQTPLPSILLNGFFVISGGFYLSFILEYLKLNPVDHFWLLFIYCMAGLSVAYFVKFVGLKISGWLFNTEEAANSYIFIVFIINKMIGILLLPFLVLMAFSTENLFSVGLTLSWCLIGAMLIYRVILTYSVVRNQVKVSPFHFFLYFLAFEIAPLLLVYKALLVYFGQTA